jgi:hypothetical protein
MTSSTRNSLWSWSVPTSHWLWALFTLGLLIGVGRVNWLPEAKTCSFWRKWAFFLSGDFSCSSEEFLIALGLEGLVLLLPSLIFGWVGQAVCQVVNAATQDFTFGGSSCPMTRS